MNNVILPLYDAPIRSYHTYADLLSIALLSEDQSENFVINNFIQLFALRTVDGWDYDDFRY